MTKDTWQQLLVQKHPQLFIRSFRGLPFSPGYPVCPDGWRDAVIRVVERVSDAATGHSVYFRRISEEHGRLRIYWNAEAALPKHVERAIEEAIELSEARSACTCATCGADARLFSSRGRLVTCCQEHARGAAVPVCPGAENLHLVRKFVGDNRCIIACRLYDRMNDRFVDIDPSSVGVGPLAWNPGSSR
jgi:hypothetical protein